ICTRSLKLYSMSYVAVPLAGSAWKLRKCLKTNHQKSEISEAPSGAFFMGLAPSPLCIETVCGEGGSLYSRGIVWFVKAAAVTSWLAAAGTKTVKEREMNTARYDLIVFGATSFVGAILVRYL